MSFHLVCHECPAEGVVEDETTANFLQDAHRETKRHNVSKQEVEKA